MRRLRRSKKCPICETNTTLDYKDISLLKKYLSERGKILGRGITGVCAKHQRNLTRSIKRARFMALLPYSQR